VAVAGAALRGRARCCSVVVVVFISFAAAVRPSLVLLDARLIVDLLDAGRPPAHSTLLSAVRAHHRPVDSTAQSAELCRL